MTHFDEIFYPVNLNLLDRDLRLWMGKRLSLEVGTPAGVTAMTDAIPQVVDALRDQWNLRVDTDTKVDYSDLRLWLIQQLTPGSAEGYQQVIGTIVSDFDCAYTARYNVVLKK